MISPGRQNDLEADHEVARVAVAAADQRPPLVPIRPPTREHGYEAGLSGIDEAERLQLLGELQHVDPGWTGDRPVLDVDLEDLFMSFTSTRSRAKRHRAVGEARVRPRGNDGNLRAVRELYDLRDLLGRGGRTTACGRTPPTCAPGGRRDASAVEERGSAGELVLVAADRDELVDQRVGSAATAMAGLNLEPRSFGDELEDVEDLDPLFLPLLGQGPLGPRATPRREC
jgi:hypothetical protein